MNLLFTFDQYYVQPFQVTFLSLCHYLSQVTKEKLQLYLVFPFKKQLTAQQYLTDFLTSTPIQLQPDQIHWLYFPKNKLLKTFPMRKRDHVTRATYYRLFLTEYLPPRVDKIIYLDCDLVIQADLTPLWTDTQFQTHQLLAAVNHGRSHPKKYYSYFFKFKNLKKRLGHSPQQLTNQSFRYFNAGMLVINVQAWRQYPKLVPKFIRFIERNHQHILYHDQDVLNFFCLPDRCLYLSTDWNYCLSVHGNPLNIHDPPSSPSNEKSNLSTKIIHYNYCYKPWEKPYPQPDHQKLWDYWWEQIDHQFFPPKNKKNRVLKTSSPRTKKKFHKSF